MSPSLPPSRRDNTGPPSELGPDLTPAVRHQAQSLRSRDPGYLDGHFATPAPLRPGPSIIIGGEDGGGDDCSYEWEWGDLYTVTATGQQYITLTYEPVDEGLFVNWHPDGRGGCPLNNREFSVDGRIVSIPDPGILSVGDQFSFQYQLDVCAEDESLDLQFVGCAPVTHSSDGLHLTFDLNAAGVQAGDFVVVSARGSSAPGGGDITLGLSCTDGRVGLLYTATPPVIEAVWAGFITGNTAPLTVDVIPNPSYLPGASGVAAIFRGVNAVGTTSATESGGVTPVVAGTGAIAVTWVGNSSFTTLQASPPTGYTLACRSPRDYSGSAVSYWFDVNGDGSPAGTWVDEGCLIVGLS